MKRRSFTLGVAALFATPALPLAIRPGYSAAISDKFGTAKLLARCHDKASPEMLQRLMRVDSETAHGLFSMLQEHRVVSTGLDGIARAVNPLNTHCVPNEAIRARDLAQSVLDVKDQLRELVERRKPTLLDPDHPDAAATLADQDDFHSGATKHNDGGEAQDGGTPPIA